MRSLCTGYSKRGMHGLNVKYKAERHRSYMQCDIECLFIKWKYVFLNQSGTCSAYYGLVRISILMNSSSPFEDLLPPRALSRPLGALFVAIG